MAKQKLEITWIGKEKRPKLEARMLREDGERLYHAGWWVSEGDVFDNRLIFGDNLLALKSLEAEFAGKVKCVHRPAVQHRQCVYPLRRRAGAFDLAGADARRLKIIKRLLSDDGSLWITIDDNEAHYLKVLCDEIFGRGNFVANVVWKKSSPQANAVWLSDNHDHGLGSAAFDGAHDFLDISLGHVLGSYFPEASRLGTGSAICDPIV